MAKLSELEANVIRSLEAVLKLLRKPARKPKNTTRRRC